MISPTDKNNPVYKSSKMDTLEAILQLKKGQSFTYLERVGPVSIRPLEQRGAMAAAMELSDLGKCSLVQRRVGPKPMNKQMTGHFDYIAQRI